MKAKKKQRQRKSNGTALRILTNSERGSFACERRWWLRYVEGLTTSDTPAPLRTGSLWHQCLATYYRNGMLFSWDEIEQAVVHPWLEQRAAWVTGTQPQERWEELLEEDKGIAALTTGMLQGYLATYGKLDHDEWEVLHVEAQAARWIPHPETGGYVSDRAPDSALSVVDGRSGRRRQWAYGGTLDLVVRLRSDGSVWLVEHKTTAETDLPQYLRKLHFDPQIRGYAWMMRKPIAQSEMREPLNIVGVIYNVARKKTPRAPQLLKDGTALSRAAIDTTRSVYLAEVLRHGFEPNDYTEILDRLKNNLFFAREVYPFTDPELDDFEKDVGHSALRIITAGRSTYHPRQQTQCVGNHGMPCPYQSSLCVADGPMARKSFTVMNIRHAELRDDLAEPNAGAERNCNGPAKAVTPDPLL